MSCIRSGIRVGLSAAAIALVTISAGATTGGSTLVEVLGYDAAEGKIFVVRHDHSEEGRAPELLYSALRGSSPGRPVRVPEIGDARIERIRKRLRPIQHSSVLDVQWHVDTLKADTLGAEWDRKPRFLLRVTLTSSRSRDSRWGFVKTIEMTTYCDGAVRLAGLYQIWDERSGEMAPPLAAIAFRGDPVESCCEVQMPVLLTPEPVHLQGVHDR